MADHALITQTTTPKDGKSRSVENSPKPHQPRYIDRKSNGHGVVFDKESNTKLHGPVSRRASSNLHGAIIEFNQEHELSDKHSAYDDVHSYTPSSAASSVLTIKHNPIGVMLKASEKYPYKFESSRLTDIKQVKHVVEQLVAEAEERGLTQHHEPTEEHLQHMTQQYLTQRGHIVLSRAASVTDRRFNLGTPSVAGSSIDTRIVERSCPSYNPTSSNKQNQKRVHHIRPILRPPPRLSVPSHRTVSLTPKPQNPADDNPAQKKIASLVAHTRTSSLRFRVGHKLQMKMAAARKRLERQHLDELLLDRAEDGMMMKRQQQEQSLLEQAKSDRVVWESVGHKELRRNVKIVIVGAGLAGLSALEELQRQGFTNVTVLEASGRVGGRLHTVNFGDVPDGATSSDGVFFPPASVELGAPAWVTESSENSVFTLAEVSGLLSTPAFPRPQCKVLTADGRVLEERFVVTALRFCQHTERDASYIYSNVFTAEQRKTSSLAFPDFSRVRRRHLLAGISEKDAHDLSMAVDAVESLWSSAAGDHLGKLAADLIGFHESTRSSYLGQRDLAWEETPLANVRSYTKRTLLAKDMHSARSIAIKSTDKMVTKLMEHIGLPSKRLKLGKRVRSVDWSMFCDKTIRSKTVPEIHLTVSYTPNVKGDADKMNRVKTYTAHHVIVTVPLGHLKKFSNDLFHPSLPKSKLDAIERVSVGTVSKIFLYYRSPLSWKQPFHLISTGKRPGEKGYSPVSLSSTSVQVATSHSSLNVVEVTLLGDIPDQALEDDAYVYTEVWRIICHGLRRKLQRPDVVAPAPERVVRTNWGDDPLFLGSHPYLSRGCHTKDIATLASPVLFRGRPVIQFAGDYTYPDYASLTHAARASGIREAQRLANFYNSFFGFENTNK